MVNWDLVGTMVGIHALSFLTLGPDNLLVIARTTGQSLKHGFGAIAGIALAGIVQVPAVAFGLDYIAQLSPNVWLIVRFAGALYLVYIGYKIVTSVKGKRDGSALDTSEPVYLAIVQGFVTNLTNPKAIMFLTAFLPQFVVVENGNVSVQLLILGVAMKLNGFICFTITALLALYMGRRIAKMLSRYGASNAPKLFSGVSIIGVGLWMLIEPIEITRRRLIATLLA